MRSPYRILMAAALCAALGVPAASYGFGLSGAGGKLGYTSPEDLDGTAMVGGHMEFEASGTRLHLMPNVMYWKADQVSDFNPNLDVYYHFREEGKTTPYLGGGLGVNVRNSEVTDDSSTDVGANVIGGVRIPGRSNHYFVEGRYTASDVPAVAVMGGVTFHTAR